MRDVNFCDKLDKFDKIEATLSFIIATKEQKEFRRSIQSKRKVALPKNVTILAKIKSHKNIPLPHGMN